MEKWFERTFEFTLPVSRFPNIVERLRGTPARVEERTRGLAPEVLTVRRGDAWSIQEQAGHLLDLEMLWLVRVEEFFAGELELTAADLANRKTHEANHNQRRLQDLLSEFRESRMRLVGRLESASGEILNRTARHPRLGTPMRLIDHALFVAEHDDHHLAAISALLT